MRTWKTHLDLWQWVGAWSRIRGKWLWVLAVLLVCSDRAPAGEPSGPTHSPSTPPIEKVVPPESVVRLAGVLKILQPNVLLIYQKEGGHSTNYSDGKAALEFVISGVLQEPLRRNR